MIFHEPGGEPRYSALVWGAAEAFRYQFSPLKSAVRPDAQDRRGGRGRCGRLRRGRPSGGRSRAVRPRVGPAAARTARRAFPGRRLVPGSAPTGRGGTKGERAPRRRKTFPGSGDRTAASACTWAAAPGTEGASRARTRVQVRRLRRVLEGVGEGSTGLGWGLRAARGANGVEFGLVVEGVWPDPRGCCGCW